MRDSNPTLERLDRPAWSLAAGLLLGLSFPPYGLYALAWVALVPLLVRWARARSLARLAVELYATFLITAVVVGGWVALHVFPGKALLLAGGLLFLPIPLALSFVLAAAVRRRLGLAAGLVALAANVLTVEWLAALGPSALPWLVLGHSQADALVVNGIADVGGVGLLSLWVLSVNALLFLGACVPARPGPLPGGRTLAGLLALATVAAAAVYSDEQLTTLDAPTATVDVALVQPAAPPDAWARFTDGERVERLAAQTDSLLRGLTAPDPSASTPVRAAGLTPPPDLVVWPEAALPVFGDGEQERRLYTRLGVWSARRGAALLTGAITDPRSAPAPSAEGPAFFSSALFFEAGRPPQQYDKMHLAPLLERVPLVGTARVPAEAMPPAPDAPFAAGQRRTLLRLDTLAFATTVGFESLLGEHVRRSVGDGAHFVVALAQNGWWGPAPGPAQHLRLTRLRAVETRRAVVVATVDGISGLVHPDGTIEAATAAGAHAAARLVVPVHDAPTFYVRHGDWPGRGAPFVAGIFSLLLLGSVLRRPPQRRAKAGKAKRR